MLGAGLSRVLLFWGQRAGDPAGRGGRSGRGVRSGRGAGSRPDTESTTRSAVSVRVDVWGRQAMSIDHCRRRREGIWTVVCLWRTELSSRDGWRQRVVDRVRQRRPRVGRMRAELASRGGDTIMCRMILRRLLPALLCTALPAVSAAQSVPAYRDTTLPIDARVRGLLGRMTLEEKFWQLYMSPGSLDDPSHDYSSGAFGLQIPTFAPGADSVDAARTHAARIN